MKKHLILLMLFSLLARPSVQAADAAYDYLVMDVTNENKKTATLIIGIGEDQPGEIAFGVKKDELFIGQRIFFRSVETRSYLIEVIAEDVEAPTVDKTSGLSVQVVHKKILRLNVEGKPIEIEINGKKLTIKPNTISVTPGMNKIFIEQEAPSKR